jgi:hypothetical protein
MTIADELAAIERRGTSARAAGMAEADNPYYSENYMPKATGEDSEIWIQKAEAWRRGWGLGPPIAAEK